ncbi:MAG TPA: ABC transporter permease [Methanosarcina vacuolata]|nr:ABC transporter permease [Methanosarcina vacuolata]
MNSFSKKTFIVARHEFLKTIKRKEFLFMTLFFPVLFAGISVVPAMISGMSPTEDQRVGYIDMTGSFEFPESIQSEGFSLEPSETKTSVVEFVMYRDISDASQALQAGQISSYLVIPEDFLKTGTIELYSLEKESSMQNMGLSSGLSNIVITSLLKDKVDELTLNRVQDPVNIKFYNVGETGESSEQGINDIFASFGLPFLTAFFLFFSIFSSSGFLLRGVAEEKENRIIEILLSSATPFEILTGKIFGLGAVGRAKL